MPRTVSGYQKLKAENESLRNDLFKIVKGSSQEAQEIFNKWLKEFEQPQESKPAEEPLPETATNEQ